jgi:hypothetical protein
MMLRDDTEFDLSVTFRPGREGPEGWPDGYVWHLESEWGTVCHYPDLGGNPLCDVDHWIVPLTGYTREEFLELAI